MDPAFSIHNLTWSDIRIEDVQWLYWNSIMNKDTMVTHHMYIPVWWEIFGRKKFHQSEHQCIAQKNSPDLILPNEQAVKF